MRIKKNNIKNIKIVECVNLFVFMCVAVFLNIGCAQKEPKADPEIIVGQSKATILKLIGDPHSVQDINKGGNYIWGPEKDFWDKIPIGTALQIWYYQYPDGKLTLYFLDGSEELNYKTFISETYDVNQ